MEYCRSGQNTWFSYGLPLATTALPFTPSNPAWRAHSSQVMTPTVSWTWYEVPTVSTVLSCTGIAQHKPGQAQGSSLYPSLSSLPSRSITPLIRAIASHLIEALFATVEYCTVAQKYITGAPLD